MAPDVATNKTLYQIISDAGLTTGLKLCLDAGDSASYNPTVQTDKWLDTSGNGYDFFRGTGTGSDAADPTFNGSAGGLSSSEYWSFDGGDYFTYDTTNETWMNNLHKDGAVYSMVGMIYRPATGAARGGICTKATNATGMQWHINSTGFLQLQVTNGASSVFSQLSTAALSTSSWGFYGGAVNEAANTYVRKINGSDESGTCTYVSPDTANASDTMRSFYTPGGGIAASGTRGGCLAVWEGVALTSTQLTNIYNAIKGRFGL